MARRDRWGMSAHACDRFTYLEAGQFVWRQCLDYGARERGRWIRLRDEQDDAVACETRSRPKPQTL